MPNELTPAQKPSDMTRAEAQHAIAQLRGTEERQKEILLEMHERNAHRAMGYKTWEEFAEGVFSLSRPRFYQLIDAAKTEQIIERNLSGLSTSSPSKLVDEMSSLLDISSTSPSTSSLSKFNDGMLLELAKLKDPDKITRAAKEALDAASTMSYRGKESRFNGQLRMPLIKGIVNRMLSAPVAPLPDVPVTPTIPDAPLNRFEQAIVDAPPVTAPSVPLPPASAKSPSKPKAAEKFARGFEHKYITCRWDEQEKVLRVIFLMADGTEGAVVVPGGYLP